MENELPELRGTLAQRAWAEKIRAEVMRIDPENAAIRLIATANGWINRRYEWGLR